MKRVNAPAGPVSRPGRRLPGWPASVVTARSSSARASEGCFPRALTRQPSRRGWMAHQTLRRHRRAARACELHSHSRAIPRRGWRLAPVFAWIEGRFPVSIAKILCEIAAMLRKILDELTALRKQQQITPPKSGRSDEHRHGSSSASSTARSSSNLLDDGKLQGSVGWRI
jgi:hypothetical protein